MGKEDNMTAAGREVIKKGPIPTAGLLRQELRKYTEEGGAGLGAIYGQRTHCHHRRPGKVSLRQDGNSTSAAK